MRVRYELWGRLYHIYLSPTRIIFNLTKDPSIWAL
jgi:hypothetical protein